MLLIDLAHFSICISKYTRNVQYISEIHTPSKMPQVCYKMMCIAISPLVFGENPLVKICQTCEFCPPNTSFLVVSSVIDPFYVCVVCCCIVEVTPNHNPVTDPTYTCVLC